MVVPIPYGLGVYGLDKVTRLVLEIKMWELVTVFDGPDGMVVPIPQRLNINWLFRILYICEEEVGKLISIFNWTNGLIGRP